MGINNHFTHFKRDVSHIPLPQNFNYPFCYEPHALAAIAAEELMEHLECLQDQRFGLADDCIGIGKMFGVLVVSDDTGNIGYLSAFSGKLNGENHFQGFVPPVFDMLDEQGFYRYDEEEINKINRTIASYETDNVYIKLKKDLSIVNQKAASELTSLKEEMTAAKKLRKQARLQNRLTISGQDVISIQEQLNQESIMQHYMLKDRKKYWKHKISVVHDKLQKWEEKILTFKEQRKSMSAVLQQKLFDVYSFTNINGKYKNLKDIFNITEDKIPPSGAGECAAPKLLQYAFLHGYKPVTMAEFWWGRSPASEIRKHRHYYPSCSSKCKPILSHMLEGVPIDPNPMLTDFNIHPDLPVLWEDEHLLIINKPADFLSVPGKTEMSSVYSLIKIKYPDATGPLLVHRLDMSTSGILLIAKNVATYHDLQQQFIQRQISKRYIAILEGLISEEYGSIDLPLRVDLNDRPRQLVCNTYGKPAITKWQLISQDEKSTKIYFYPLTGRTHQLRVHAAHPLGLNTPIKGDDLYGQRENRLYLHADRISFVHPTTKKHMTIHCPATF